MTPRGRRARHRAFGRAVFLRFDADRMRRRSEPVSFDDLGNEPGRALPNRIPIGTNFGGRCEIRTHEGLSPLPVFKTGALNRSANLPISG